jgi:hypothetical protein
MSDPIFFDGQLFPCNENTEEIERLVDPYLIEVSKVIRSKDTAEIGTLIIQVKGLPEELWLDLALKFPERLGADLQQIRPKKLRTRISNIKP